MGACYSVSAKMNFKGNDPTGFCSTVRSMVKQYEAEDRARFRKYEDSEDPFKWFSVLAPDAYDLKGLWCADFSASYGWWGVMVDIFEQAIKECNEDSKVALSTWDDSGDLYIITPSGSGYKDTDEEDDLFAE